MRMKTHGLYVIADHKPESMRSFETHAPSHSAQFISIPTSELIKSSNAMPKFSKFPHRIPICTFPPSTSTAA